MKKSNFKYLLGILAVVLVYACSKDSGVTNQPYQTYDVPYSQGQLKINLGFAYTINYNTLLLKINDSVVSNSLTTRNPFPGGGYNTGGSNFALYLSVKQGDNNVSVVIPKFGTAIDSVVLYKTKINIPDNRNYTLHIADTMIDASTNNTKSLLVKNLINDMDTGWCRFKFVNMIPNLPAVDLYLNGVLIKSAIPFMNATDSFSVRTGVYQPGYTGATTTWAVRPAGALATSTATASYASANGLQSQKVMTIFTMGYAGMTGTRLPFVCFTLDKNQ
ncbi:MAG: hypothetical protein NTZ19_04610 [Bacteroidetes bacterium]|nr:hypothetical protein [Bacteroidota bacterium]